MSFSFFSFHFLFFFAFLLLEWLWDWPLGEAISDAEISAKLEASRMATFKALFFLCVYVCVCVCCFCSTVAWNCTRIDLQQQPPRLEIWVVARWKQKNRQPSPTSRTAFSMGEAGRRCAGLVSKTVLSSGCYFLSNIQPYALMTSANNGASHADLFVLHESVKIGKTTGKRKLDST